MEPWLERAVLAAVAGVVEAAFDTKPEHSGPVCMCKSMYFTSAPYLVATSAAFSCSRLSRPLSWARSDATARRTWLRVLHVFRHRQHEQDDDRKNVVPVFSKESHEVKWRLGLLLRLTLRRVLVDLFFETQRSG